MKAVIGLGFGDEGKGVTTDWLCASSFRDSIVVRFSGGHQAGHNVVIDDVNHVFSNFGSGTLRDCSTYWDEGCTIDPVGIKNEYNILKNKGITPVLYINKSCPITTPLEKYTNKSCNDTNKHGSCGVGFWETLKREKAMFSLTAMDLKHEVAFNMKRDIISSEYYNGKEMHIDDLFEFLSACEWLSKCEDVIFVDNLTQAHNYSGIIYEGSQGLLLDQNIGFFPHCTPSNTGSKYFTDRNINPDYYLVTRAYQTRHGNGPMTNHGDFKPLDNPNEQNLDDGSQGIFRKSMLDLDLLKYAIAKDGAFHDYNSTLVITCLEHMPRLVFWHDGKEHEFEDEIEFGREITKRLDLQKFALCKNHEFIFTTDNIWTMDRELQVA